VVLSSVADCRGDGGITIYINAFDHPPPHVHAYQAEDEVVLNIKTLDIIDGGFSGKAFKKVKRWVDDNREKLLRYWGLAQKGEKFDPIEEC
jgi:hypothetical protein